MKRLIRGMARTGSGLTLLHGVACMLTGVERLLSTRSAPGTSNRGSTARQGTVTKPVVAPLSRERHYFRISQTRSEIGYVYWVAQGFGCYQSFTLFDTWQEAVTEVNRRVKETSVPAELAEPAFA